MSRSVASTLLLLLTSGFAFGCALYTDVDISPLPPSPAKIDRGGDMESMVSRSDFLRAMEAGASYDDRTKVSSHNLAWLGRAYLASGRYDDARKRLRAALDGGPERTAYAEIAWDLSQVEYLSNNFESSLDWALIAAERGLRIKQWHLDYVKALASIPVYRFSGATSAKLAFAFGKPDVPRVRARVNGTREQEAIIDSGAVVSIVSQRLATELGVKQLGTVEGTFYGLLGEPIAVTFGVLDRLELGGIVVENVPVAVMPDDKMRFLISRKNKTEFRMDFLLGANLLKEFRLELDFGGSRAVFTRLTDRDRVPAADQNLFFAGFRPHLRGTINRHGWFLFVLDTGSEVTFLNEGRISSLPVSTFGATHTAMLQGLGGAMKRGAKLERVEIGVDKWGGLFRTLPMYFADAKESAAGIIGQNLLKKFNVVIDFGRMRVDLKRR